MIKGEKMKQNLMKLVNSTIRLGFKRNKKVVGYQQSGQVIVLGSNGGWIDEKLCWEIINHYPKQLILVGGKTEQLKRMEQEIKATCPKLLFEPIVLDKSLEDWIEYFKNQYDPNLFIVGEEGKQMKYLSA